MYIYDCLYGKIEFDKQIYLCMLTPEMQRLREVRLGNINSLFLTGSANINRFEHSIGTAYLAKINYEENAIQSKKNEKNNFILAALFHDLANGPFGHSYEYLQKKQGFIPEKNIGSVINCNDSGSYKKNVSLEPIYFGQYNRIHSLLKKEEIEIIDGIVSGNNAKFSKLISDKIDLDNIDNVFRMAFHMGIAFSKDAPVQLAKSMICKDNNIYFKECALPYLYEWYNVRSKVYKLLLFNPQDFSAKCMLTEIMDAVLEDNPQSIKWNYTDYDLISSLKDIGEIWVDELARIDYIKENECNIKDGLEKKENVRELLKNYFAIEIPSNATIDVKKRKQEIKINFYNTDYVFTEDNLYRIRKQSINISKIVSRLMTGDLYYCLAIFTTKQTEFYNYFSKATIRRRLEEECNKYIFDNLNNREINIAFHAIVDMNKTNRQLDVRYLTGEQILLGEATNDLILGVFIKTPKYGLATGKQISTTKQKKLEKLVTSYLLKLGINKLETKELYGEVKEIE